MLLVLKIDIYLLWVGLDTSKIRGIHKITDEILHRQATSHKLPIRVVAGGECDWSEAAVSNKFDIDVKGFCFRLFSIVQIACARTQCRV